MKVGMETEKASEVEATDSSIGLLHNSHSITLPIIMDRCRIVISKMMIVATMKNSNSRNSSIKAKKVPSNQTRVFKILTMNSPST
jgi:hypothetical protein